MASSSSSGAGSSPPRTNAGAIIVERSPAGVSPVGARRQVLSQWGGGPGRMALSYDAPQTCYVVRGKVTAAVEGSPEKGRIELGGGDLVVFPKGTRCTWHIAVAVDMHYAFDPS